MGWHWQRLGAANANVDVNDDLVRVKGDGLRDNVNDNCAANDNCLLYVFQFIKSFRYAARHQFAFAEHLCDAAACCTLATVA